MAHEDVDPSSIELGIPSIDAEHREQLKRMNRLSDSIAQGGAPERIADDLEELIDYLAAHFMSEQIAMRQHGYPEYEAHLREHDDAVTILRDLHARFMAGEISVSGDLLRALRNWLIAHIDSADRRLAAFMLARGADVP
jgi:hemerythrin